jgi:hypothetical protein
MKKVLLGIAACILMASAASADVRLTMHDGRVTLVAKDATVRQILAEWARVGQTKIVNMERVPGGPISLELTNVPEAQALEILMRTLSGYITAPRPVVVANLSLYDRIIVMPTLASARPATSAPPPPVFQQPSPQFQTPQAADDDVDDRPAPNVQVPPTPPRGPVFNSFPQPQVATPQVPMSQPGAMPPQQQQVPPQQGQPAVASPQPVAPYGGVAVPGMVAPAPPQQPGQAIKRPGGR